MEEPTAPPETPSLMDAPYGQSKRGSQVSSLKATENGAAAEKEEDKSESNPYSETKNDGGDVYVVSQDQNDLEELKLKVGVRRQTKLGGSDGERQGPASAQHGCCGWRCCGKTSGAGQ